MKFTALSLRLFCAATAYSQMMALSTSTFESSSDGVIAQVADGAGWRTAVTLVNMATTPTAHYWMRMTNGRGCSRSPRMSPASAILAATGPIWYCAICGRTCPRSENSSRNAPAAIRRRRTRSWEPCQGACRPTRRSAMKETLGKDGRSPRRGEARNGGRAGAQLYSCSRRRGSSSAKLHGRCRMSNCGARISSQPSRHAPGEPGNANR